jgi:hypothetical protein
VRIAVVGGLERHEAEIAKRAAHGGHDVEFHRGRVGGRHAEELEAIVERSDLVVIVTEVNSHGAVLIAKKAAHRCGRPSIIVRRRARPRAAAGGAGADGRGLLRGRWIGVRLLARACARAKYAV